MEALHTLVTQALAGRMDAYSALVRRFQDMAVGYAYSHLGDFHLAEDAAQEAFVQAFLDLSRLREPEAFPGWLRRIVFKHCDRIARKRRLPVVSLDAVGEIGVEGKDPVEILDQQRVKDRVSLAIQGLPEHQRMVVSLFYISEYSHREIAAFLGAPVQTVKNRLYASRKRLKKELIDMAKEELQGQRPSRDTKFVTHIMDDLVDLSDRSIRYVLCDVDTKDCAIALKGASQAVRDKILSNVSERVRNFIEDRMETLGEIDNSEVQRAQKTVMAALNKTQPRPKRLSKKYLTMKRDLGKRLQKTPFSQMGLDDIADVIADMCTIARMEGMLALEEFEQIVREDENEKLFVIGLRMAINRVGQDISRDILEKRMRLLLQEQETRCRMIIEGITELEGSLCSGPLRAKLHAHYSLLHEIDEKDWGSSV